MGLLNCEKCLEYPCECGYKYKDLKPEYLSKFIASIVRYKEQKEARIILKDALILIENKE